MCVFRATSRTNPHERRADAPRIVRNVVTERERREVWRKMGQTAHIYGFGSQYQIAYGMYIYTCYTRINRNMISGIMGRPDLGTLFTEQHSLDTPCTARIKSKIHEAYRGMLYIYINIRMGARRVQGERRHFSHALTSHIYEHIYTIIYTYGNRR